MNGEIKFVYFDVGGAVISDLTSNNGWLQMKRDIGVKEEYNESFEKFFNKEEARVCIGKDVEDLVPIMQKRYGMVFSKRYSFLMDFVNRFEKNISIWSVIKKVKRKCRIGLLTNMYPGMLGAIYKRGLIPDVRWDVIIDSSVEGVAKPDPKVFKLSEHRAGVKGNGILFIDNSPKHIKAAQEFGWKTFLYNSTDPTRSSQDLSQYWDKMVL